MTPSAGMFWASIEIGGGMTTNHTLDVPGATLAYDVHGPLPTADGRPR